MWGQGQPQAEAKGSGRYSHVAGKWDVGPGSKPKGASMNAVAAIGDNVGQVFFLAPRDNEAGF
eukprot:12928812-Prorocentrum_lima.AAC.1